MSVYDQQWMVTNADETRAVGEALGRLLRAGDLVM